MSDRAFLFLFSILMIVGGIATAVWLVASGQADSVDGLFLALTALLVALAFGLYLKFLIGRGMQPPAAAKTASASRA